MTVAYEVRLTQVVNGEHGVRDTHGVTCAHSVTVEHGVTVAHNVRVTQVVNGEHASVVLHEKSTLMKGLALLNV